MDPIDWLYLQDNAHDSTMMAIVPGGVLVREAAWVDDTSVLSMVFVPCDAAGQQAWLAMVKAEEKPAEKK